MKDEDRNLKMMHETRWLIINLTKWYLDRLYGLPTHKHDQYIRVIDKLKARHNTYALKGNGCLL